MSTTERVTVSCSHSHTVTLRLDEGEWRGHTDHWIREARLTTGKYAELLVPNWDDWWVRIGAWPAEAEPRGLRAELEAALAAAEASCGGCGCADRLRAEAERRAKKMGARRAGKTITYGLMHAADFLDAAPDARGSDLSAEQPAPVSEQGHAKKRANWNDPKEATNG